YSLLLIVQAGKGGMEQRQLETTRQGPEGRRRRSAFRRTTARTGPVPGPVFRARQAPKEKKISPRAV
ncbi:MAG: hypothetical protein AB7T74_17050, partial [Clostridia bacterium]